MEKIEFISKTPQDTFECGEGLGRSLGGGELVLLYGGLGAGKTLLTKGIMHGLGYDIDEVTSPSFTLVNLYKSPRFDVYHIDLWRLHPNQDVTTAVGLHEILEDEQAVTVIEWADRLGETSFTNRTTTVKIVGDGDEPRRISIENNETAAGLRIVIRKGDRSLAILRSHETVKQYNCVLGFEPVGSKQIEGDGKTPEGDFYIFTKNADSKYFLSLGISYPSVNDATRGLDEGLICQSEYDEIIIANRERRKPLQNTALGGSIYIHGGGVEGDWTRGCPAVENADMQEIFDAVEIGTPITILP